MALRAFRCNPSLGGFGGESSTISVLRSQNENHNEFDSNSPVEQKESSCDSLFGKKKNTDSKVKLTAQKKIVHVGGLGSDDDAFAQIVKELVDNAVDACSSSSKETHNDSKTNKNFACVNKNSIPKRVKVVLEPIKHSTAPINTGGGSNPINGEEFLRVTVSDNGVGMENIGKCVTAFCTSKGQDENEKILQSKRKSNRDKTQDLTAGRYGIGLTLCLLHAQRLVPNSFASITSATQESTNWTRSRYVVDTQNDAVLCVKEEYLPKTRPDESGTAVSLLVPGGAPARRAWPRLAEYLSRFHLSRKLRCSLQVMAPTLSLQPLFVRPSMQVGETKKQDKNGAVVCQMKEVMEGQNIHNLELLDDEDNDWNDGMLDDVEESSLQIDDIDVDQTLNHQEKSSKCSDDASCKPEKNEKNPDENEKQMEPQAKLKQDENQIERWEILSAAQSYLCRPIELKNVAYSIQPIRKMHSSFKAQKKPSKFDSCPMLEVDMIVYGQENDEDDIEHNWGCEEKNTYEPNHRFDVHTSSSEDQSEAKLMLVRMVNRIPLLDGAEAHACGLVRGISSKLSLWNSFGLDIAKIDSPKVSNTFQVAHKTDKDVDLNKSKLSELELHIPMFAIKDSIQVLPYFQSSTHALFESKEIGEKSEIEANYADSKAGDCENSSEVTLNCQKRNKIEYGKRLLPANLRIGNILMIVQIHAKPSALPLPTLSKGRLPLNDPSIDDALEVGLLECLRSLQRTNPRLLLTTHELKRTERDARYVPAIAAALASIICNSRCNDFQKKSIDATLGWKMAGHEVKDNPNDSVQGVDGNDKSRDCSSSPQSTQKRSSYEKKHCINKFILPRTTKEMCRVNNIGPLLEERIRSVLSDCETLSKMKKEKINAKKSIHESEEKYPINCNYPNDDEKEQTNKNNKDSYKPTEVENDLENNQNKNHISLEELCKDNNNKSTGKLDDTEHKLPPRGKEINTNTDNDSCTSSFVDEFITSNDPNNKTVEKEQNIEDKLFSNDKDSNIGSDNNSCTSSFGDDLATMDDLNGDATEKLSDGAHQLHSEEKDIDKESCNISSSTGSFDDDLSTMNDLEDDDRTKKSSERDLQLPDDGKEIDDESSNISSVSSYIDDLGVSEGENCLNDCNTILSNQEMNQEDNQEEDNFDSNEWW